MKSSEVDPHIVEANARVLYNSLYCDAVWIVALSETLRRSGEPHAEDSQ